MSYPLLHHHPLADVSEEDEDVYPVGQTEKRGLLRKFNATTQTDRMNLGTRVVTPSFKPASLHVWVTSIGNPFPYELHLFHQLCASQKVTNICRNVFPVVHAISHSKWTLNAVSEC